jgi:glycosyltransferase involved in cell wall biosynthesis
VLAGPEMPNFTRFWNMFTRRDRVERLGVLTDAGKRDFYANIDAFALPSRSDSFGLVLLEAWANGKPNLVYRAGGPGELVRDGVDGLHAAVGDVEGLSRQLIRLATDAQLRRRLGECGRSRIASEFNWVEKLEIVRRELDALSSSRDRGAAGSRCSRGKSRPSRSPAERRAPCA